VELLDGMLVSMPPIGPRHAFAHRFAQRYLELRCGGAVEFSASSSLILSRITQLQPDLLVLRADAYDGTPRYWKPDDVIAVIEIADSSLKHDAGAKSSAYARGGIHEYLVIDVARERIIRHRAPGPDGFELVDTLRRDDRFSLDRLPAIELEVSGFFPGSP
jgi:Uma2 family endonuclease